MSPRPATDIEVQVMEIVKEALEGTVPVQLTPETSFIGDLEMDSLTIVRIDMLIQGKLKLALAAEDIESIETIGDLVRALKERGQPV